MSPKQKNQKIYCRTAAEFNRVAEELRDYIGREFVSDPDRLEITVLALPRHYKKKAKREAKLRRQKQNRGGYSYNDTYNDGDYQDAALRYNRR